VIARDLRLARGEHGEGGHERRQDRHDDHRHRERDALFVLDEFPDLHLGPQPHAIRNLGPAMCR